MAERPLRSFSFTRARSRSCCGCPAFHCSRARAAALASTSRSRSVVSSEATTPCSTGSAGVLVASSGAVALSREARVVAICTPAPVRGRTHKPAVAKMAPKLAREQVLGWISASQRIALATFVEDDLRQVEDFSIDDGFVLRREALALERATRLCMSYSVEGL